MAHIFDPNTREAEADESHEFETSLVYREFQDNQGYREKHYLRKMGTGVVTGRYIFKFRSEFPTG